MINKQCTRNLFLAILAWAFSCLNLSGQIVINEICPTNASVISNSNGQFDDWIELHNAGSSAVNLNGFSLADDSTKPFQFTFPSYSLEGGQKVIVFASDHTNKIIVDHWEMPVNAGAIWRYSAGSVSIDTNWRNLNFIDTVWSSGYGGIGFGDGDDNTTIPVGVSVMIRKTFSIPDTSQILKAVLLMDYDDGFVAYLNGVEIARANIGTKGFRPLWNDLAGYSHEALSYRGLPLDSFYLSPSILKSLIRPGTNVLAIEVHNTPANSDDLSAIPYLFFGMRSPGSTFIPIPPWFHVPVREYFSAKFKLNRLGETIFLNNSSGITIDRKVYPAMEINNSYCRIPDGSANWCFVDTPTPEATNNSSTCFNSYAYEPIFSKQGGYYVSTQTLTLSTITPGGVIHYTTNGNTPDISSPVYSSPINLPATTSVRAKVFANGSLPSPTVTNTYFINGITHLSTFSITTDSLNLWDYNTGIYVLGPNAAPTYPYLGANFHQNWEKPATIEFYDKNKNLVVKFDADIKIYGNYSRAKPQKSFEIKLKSSYGTGSFIYPLYSDKPYVDDISNIILRNSGTDWNKVHFRDAMMERLLKKTNCGYLAAQPTIAYLNGAYWGVYCIDENHDQHWMKNNFGLNKSEIDYLKESGNNIKVEAGSDSSYWTLYNYATTQIPTTQQYYDNINSSLDLKNYTDYFAAETFYNNGDWIGDWTNNIKMWRPNSPGSKWKYLLYDLDFGLGLFGTQNDNRLAIARNPLAFSHSSEMFDAILKNPTYKRYFINRYADLMNTIFLPSNMNTIMHSLKDTMSFDMPAHFAKWGSSTTNWNTEITNMMNFANARPDIMKGFIKSEFSLAGIVTLTFQTSPVGSGRIEISTITPTTYPWTGDYFNGNPVTITAIPNPGYTFDHWRSSKVINRDNPNQTVTYNFTRDDAIKAFFTGSAIAPKICVSELNYNSNSAYNSGDWIELHNYGTMNIDISGWRLSDGNDNHNFIFPTGTQIPVNGYLVLVEDSFKFKSQFPTVTNWLGLTGFNFSNKGDQVRLFNNVDVLYLSFFYQDLAPWPLQADGLGYTCELKTNLSDPNNGSNWFAGCIGGSPGRAYNSTLSVPVFISGSTTFCGGSSAVLHASYFQGSTYQWKKNNVNITGAIDSVYSASQAGSYSVNITNNGCSAVTPPSAVSIVTQQPDPSTTSATRCGTGELTLFATSSDSVYWYDGSSGGNLIGVGDTLHIPFLIQTTTYYARTGKNCPSNPVATIAEITPPAASPVSNDTLRCGPGSMTLIATDTAEIRWYNAPSGGGLLATGSSFTTNILENDTSYFIEAGSVCPSSRIEVRVSIIATPEPVVTNASHCGDGILTLTANSTAPVLWYKNQSGGSSLGSGLSFTTPYLSAADTFYAEANNGCPSARVRGIAIVNPIPPDPIAENVTVCTPGNITLTADGTEQVNWYDSSAGGNLLYTGSIFITPVLSSTNTYYASTGYECPSNRIPVQAIVSSSPSSPVASDVSRCDTGSVTLNAASSDTIYWYDSPVNGNLLAMGNVFDTPSLVSTTTYFTEAGSYCRSNRIAVQAVINQIPSPPVVTDASRCGPGTLSLTAISSEPIYWYSSDSGGSPIATDSLFTTPSILNTTTYFLEDGNICRSNRISVNAVIMQPPSNPVVSNNSRCGLGTVTFTASSVATVFWYDSPSGGNALDTGLSFTTPSLSSSITYFAEAMDNCSSERIPVQAIVEGTQVSFVSDGYHCGPGSALLSAAGPVINDSIFWYDQPGGNIIGSGGNFTTPYISTNTTYYVTANSACTGVSVAVNAKIYPVLIVNLGPDTITIPGGQTIALDAGPGYISYHWSTGETTPQIHISSPGNYVVVVSDSNGCTATDGVFVNIITTISTVNGSAAIKLYPNPAKEQVTVEISDLPSKMVLIKLFSIDGKILRSEEVNSVNGQLRKIVSLSGIAQGVYFLEVESDKYSTTIKVIVE